MLPVEVSATQDPCVASFRSRFAGWLQPCHEQRGTSDLNLACQLGAGSHGRGMGPLVHNISGIKMLVQRNTCLSS